MCKNIYLIQTLHSVHWIDYRYRHTRWTKLQRLFPSEEIDDPGHLCKHTRRSCQKYNIRSTFARLASFHPSLIRYGKTRREQKLYIADFTRFPVPQHSYFINEQDTSKMETHPFLAHQYTRIDFVSVWIVVTEFRESMREPGTPKVRPNLQNIDKYSSHERFKD